MAINQAPSGESVYIPEEENYNSRCQHPLYQLARDVVRRESQTGHVADLGGGPLLATSPLLQEGFTVHNFELDSSTLDHNQSRFGYLPNLNQYQSDLSLGFPPIDANLAQDLDSFLALDILEHLSTAEAINLLQSIRRTKGDQDYTIVVSMPIISPKTIATWMESAHTAMLLRRPASGLLDRTHQILTDQEGHHRLFTDAGYLITGEFYTTLYRGIVPVNGYQMPSTESTEIDQPHNIISDASENSAKPKGSPNSISRVSIVDRIAKRVITQIVPTIIHPTDEQRRAELEQEYQKVQGVYILKPPQSTLR